MLQINIKGQAGRSPMNNTGEKAMVFPERNIMP